VQNRSPRPVNLQGFYLQVLDPKTAQVDPDSPGVTINQAIGVQPRQSVSIDRVSDVVDADGERVDGTFEGERRSTSDPGIRSPRLTRAVRWRTPLPSSPARTELSPYTPVFLR
jgi:hypothetical protein